MTIVFFIKSSTVNLDNYTIKDVTGSSGRLDVISRCILAAILKTDGFEDDIEIWVFLDNYGTFVFNSELDFEKFPKNELLFTDYFAKFLLELNSKQKILENPLSSVQVLSMKMLEAIKNFQAQSYKIYTMSEDGDDFFKIRKKIMGNKNILFIVGSQDDQYLSSTEFLALNIPKLSIGNQSYLASSVIRLLKLLIFVL